MTTTPKRYQEYLQFSKKYPKLVEKKGDYKKGEIELVKDPKLFKKCEESAAKDMVDKGVSAKKAKERGKIGIREKNRWGVSVCDPVKFPPDGDLGTFVRFIPWSQLEGRKAGKVIVPVTSEGKLILLKNFRHPTRSWALEFPRGTDDIGESVESELKEEAGAKVTSSPKKIGEITPDSGVLASETEVYFVKVKLTSKPSPQMTEAIKGVVLMSKDEFLESLSKGIFKNKDKKYEVKDAFTISAFSLAEKRGLI